ncbi:hypothetical protein MA16_Dca022009 [Dendrobium catenatum]|uniref:Uncharacterized protein n=1 Tax=Dendrobium catenatum TaxID=906689 RepID=A0A2I0WRF4_9ASPA|nr:hypothetical protein MA16_Dca022009 [Dendrobium catenatum]
MFSLLLIVDEEGKADTTNKIINAKEDREEGELIEDGRNADKEVVQNAWRNKVKKEGKGDGIQNEVVGVNLEKSVPATQKLKLLKELKHLGPLINSTRSKKSEAILKDISSSRLSNNGSFGADFKDLNVLTRGSSRTI